ncbi:MAG: DDE-type integrase/transposase/recombinase, partial [Candidatus Thiodiazotropha endolucinida]|nr:DDE-type integrase/transposase/recombinase [Candidatus Thiodiazotropha taylori]MCW4346457.1 DDE-type integrase/transposase/recombinase [Candidatus Thiodiazotropha endolucinida]
VLYYSWANRDDRSDCLVGPAKFRQKVLYLCHDLKSSGHLGQTKTLDRLKQQFYWHGMSRDCNIYVQQCGTCNKNKRGNRTPRSAQEMYHAGYPMERVHLDILGPINPKSRSGSVYVLVMVDQFTKWVELAALPAQNAELTAIAFLKHFVVTFGCPLELHTDQGRNFESDLFQSFCKLLEITKTRTTPYHPSGNGQVEVFNRTILQMIRTYISRGFKDWDEHLPLIAMALHSMKNQSTGFSANMLMLGREIIQPIDLILGLSSATPRDPPSWVDNLTRNLANVHKLAREKIGNTQLRQKRDYDLRVFEKSYKEGDVVYLRDSSSQIGISSKLRPPWKGPYLVVRARPPVYALQGRRKVQFVHHDRIKVCCDSVFPLWLQRQRHELLNTLPMTAGENENEDPEESSQDRFPDGGLFDPDQTLPYMWGDCSDMPLPYLFGEDSQTFDSGAEGSIGDIDSTSQMPTGDSDSGSNDDAILEPRTTRAGRKIQLPARFRD